MASFKLAAIKVLKEEGKPLHSKEITKKALEKGLIETSGETPEATMNAQIITDINRKKENSVFIKTGPSTFGLNKDVLEKEEKQEEEEEEERQEEEKERISTQYIGTAGEHRVVSELLFRGYNASLMSVDDGIDINAVKDNQLFNIQVKTANLNKYNTYVFDLGVNPFEKYNTGNTYYIFVLMGEGDKTNFLIIPYTEMKKYVDTEYIRKVNKNTRYRVNVRFREGKFYLGTRDNDVSYYVNNWDLV